MWIWSRSENLSYINKKHIKKSYWATVAGHLHFKSLISPYFQALPKTPFSLSILSGHQSPELNSWTSKYRRREGRGVCLSSSVPSLSTTATEGFLRQATGAFGSQFTQRNPISFGPVLPSYPLMPFKCPLHHIRRFSSNSQETGG